ncbi:MAG: CBASS oligonucleotide cyclase [Cyanobacteria bacterium MAG IRC4_bin_6]|nr:CBASS oligonucleotide cyclase [Cyanobacteria bacterium MAG IRC3_bin_20]MDE0648218.1 CBASS oligonucleotide cyclase [Cyanobacteria bacterium MAG IRC4_bin_6]
MITVTEAFETFRKRLELSKTEQEDAIRRHKSVRECLRSEFDIKRDFLTGSYARHTKTKPLKDIDIFFCLGESDDHWRNEEPKDVLSAFEKCLAAQYGATNVETGRRCVTVTFPKRNPTADMEGKVLSNDAVPAYSISGRYEIPDGQIGKWIKTNPEVHSAATTKKNKSLDGKWVPLVKMLKRWNRSADCPIQPSFLIEVMALELVDPPFTSYPSEVRRFFAAAMDGINREWPDPAGLGPAVSDQMTPEDRELAKQKLREAEMSAARASMLEQQGRNGEALALWGNIMGKYFPTR